MQTETKTMLSKIALSTVLVLGAASLAQANAYEHEGPIAYPVVGFETQRSVGGLDAFASARVVVQERNSAAQTQIDRISGKDY